MLEKDEQYKEIKSLIADTMKTVREVSEMAKESQRMSEQTMREFRENSIESQRISQESQRISQESQRMSQKSEQTMQEFREEFQKINLVTQKMAQDALAAAAEASAAAKDASETAKDARKVAREASKIVGDIGNKFGRFTEGLAWNSMQRIMRKRFGCQYVTPHFKVYDTKGEIKLELDGYGYANGTTNTVCFVEIKSRLRSRDVEQVLGVIDKFGTYFPDHKNKTVYGILSYVEGFDDGAKQLAEQSGIYLASIHEKIFKIEHEGKGFLIA